MAEKKGDCGCGCVPLEKDSGKTAEDKQKVEAPK